jgi:hypothetical protein
MTEMDDPDRNALQIERQQRRRISTLLMIAMAFGGALIVGGVLWGITTAGGPIVSTGQGNRTAPAAAPPVQQK